MMNPPRPLAERFRKEALVAQTLWNTLDVGVEQLPYSADNLARVVADATGEDMRHELISGYIEKMIEDGSITRRGPVYGTRDNGLNQGRNYGWTLVVSLDEALARMAKRQERDAASWQVGHHKGIKASADTRRGKPQPRKAKEVVYDVPDTRPHVAIATRDSEETRAIAGPDPESTLKVKLSEVIRATGRSDHASALVEAARQYANRGTSMKTQIDDLVKTAEGMGLTVDREALEKTLSFQPDERLETVALVLPYVDMLEAAVERGISNVKELNRKYADYDQIKRDLRHFREERDRRLVSGVAN